MGRRKKPAAIKNTETITTRIPYELYHRIELLAQKQGLNNSQIARLILREYFSRPARERTLDDKEPV